MLNIKRILYTALLAVSCVLLTQACLREDPVGETSKHSVAVQLKLGTKADGDLAFDSTDDELAIHTLRVYAYVRGELVGHHFWDDDMQTPIHKWMHLTMTTLGTENVDFYLIANEASMSRPGAEMPFTDSFTESDLNHYYFTVLSNAADNGLPMFAKETKTIDFSDLSDTPPADPEHASHVVNGSLDFVLQRSLGKLGFFAAKSEEDAALVITGITNLSSGTKAFNYLMPQSLTTLQAVGQFYGEVYVPYIEDEITSTLAPDCSPADRQNPDNYTDILSEPHYIYENPWGSDSWDTPGDSKGYVIRIDYSFDDRAFSGYVYMPPVERNKYYMLCCLFKDSGELSVVYNVADWETDDFYEIDFDYPSYTLIQPLAGGTPPYAEPTVYYNTDPESLAGTYSFSFSIPGPTAQVWTPTLMDATSADYEITVYQAGNLCTPPYMASPDPYEIRIRALKNSNVGKTSRFVIACPTQWDNSRIIPLLINMQSGASNWEGSNESEVVIVRQVPTS